MGFWSDSMENSVVLDAADDIEPELELKAVAERPVAVGGFPQGEVAVEAPAR